MSTLSIPPAGTRVIENNVKLLIKLGDFESIEIEKKEISVFEGTKEEAKIEDEEQFNRIQEAIKNNIVSILEELGLEHRPEDKNAPSLSKNKRGKNKNDVEEYKNQDSDDNGSDSSDSCDTYDNTCDDLGF